MIAFVLNSTSIISSIFAAYFWFKSGIVRFPDIINVGYGGLGGTIDDLGKALIKQGKLNCYGAIAASVSAFAQLVSMILSNYAI